VANREQPQVPKLPSPELPESPVPDTPTPVLTIGTTEPTYVNVPLEQTTATSSSAFPVYTAPNVDAVTVGGATTSNTPPSLKTPAQSMQALAAPQFALSVFTATHDDSVAVAHSTGPTATTVTGHAARIPNPLPSSMAAQLTPPDLAAPLPAQPPGPTAATVTPSVRTLVTPPSTLLVSAAKHSDAVTDHAVRLPNSLPSSEPELAAPLPAHPMDLTADTTIPSVRTLVASPSILLGVNVATHSDAVTADAAKTS
jgi:hypothetical protein